MDEPFLTPQLRLIGEGRRRTTKDDNLIGGREQAKTPWTGQNPH
jgi:hypothetical protein